MLNLSEVGIVDCAGVRMLAQVMQAWLDDGRNALAVCPEGLVSKVLRLTGFSRQFVVVPAFVPADPEGGRGQVRFLRRAGPAAS